MSQSLSRLSEGRPVVRAPNTTSLRSTRATASLRALPAARCGLVFFFCEERRSVKGVLAWARTTSRPCNRLRRLVAACSRSPSLPLSLSPSLPLPQRAFSSLDSSSLRLDSDGACGRSDATANARCWDHLWFQSANDSWHSMICCNV